VVAQPSVKRADKVELLSIEYEKGYILKILESKSVEGKEACDILTVWKQQNITGPSPSACHQPAYAIKFYSKGKLVVLATVWVP
jgi:hypothetical protein